MRVTRGSKVRRSLSCIFLIDADLAQGAGKNITENITQNGASNRAGVRFLAVNGI